MFKVPGGIVEVGAEVEVVLFDGVRQVVKVDAVYEDVNHGKPGIGFVDGGGHGHWAYLDQVEWVY